MFVFANAVLTAAAGIVVMLLPKRIWESFLPFRGSVVTGIFALAALLLCGSIFVTTPEGERGIVKTFGAASDVALDPGLSMIWPWQTVEYLSVRDQCYTAEFQSQSNDLQEMTIQMTTIWRRDPEKIVDIYRAVRDRSEDTNVTPSAREVLKAKAATFDAPALIQRRAELSEAVNGAMESRIGRSHLVMVENSITQVDFNPNYDSAVEAKVVAKEAALKAEYELQEKEVFAEITAVQRSGEGRAEEERARGSAAAQRLIADANAYERETLAMATAYETAVVGAAKAERVAWIGQALNGNPQAVLFEALVNWDGSVPQVLVGGNQGELFPFGAMETDATYSAVQPTTLSFATESDLLDRVEVFIARMREMDAGDETSDVAPAEAP